MSASHTPGPWGVRSFPAYGYCITAADSSQARDGFAVVSFADASRGRTTDRASADARLIAAAPDLLAALHDLLSATFEDGDDNVRDISDCLNAALISEARAAIAKATGAAS